MSKQLTLRVIFQILLLTNVQAMAQTSAGKERSNLTIENFEKIAAYAKKTAIDIGGISSLYSFQLGDIHGQYRPAFSNGQSAFPDTIKICGNDQCFEMQLKNSSIEWKYFSMKEWDRKEMEIVLYSLIGRVIVKINEK